MLVCIAVRKNRAWIFRNENRENEIRRGFRLRKSLPNMRRMKTEKIKISREVRLRESLPNRILVQLLSRLNSGTTYQPLMLESKQTQL